MNQRVHPRSRGELEYLAPGPGGLAASQAAMCVPPGNMPALGAGMPPGMGGTRNQGVHGPRRIGGWRMTSVGGVAGRSAFWVLALATAGLGNDWPYWRGPEQTGMTREKASVTKWSPDGENLLWKVPVGGRSTPVVMDGRVYVITPVGQNETLQERVVCLDEETGKTLWEYKFNVFHTDIVEARVGWTAPVGDPETGNVYVHGTGGELFCFDRKGKVVWKWSLEEELGRYSGYGGRLHTPIIDEDRVVISVVYILAGWGTGSQKSGHRYFAFDKRNGQMVWWAQPGSPPTDTTYSCPVVSVIDGKRMLVAPNADGNVYGMVARTGEKLWTFKLSKRGLNSSPVVSGNFVYVTHSEENHDTTEMGRVVCIDASKRGDITTSGEVWRVDGIPAGYSSPAIANGRLYVPTNGGKLHAMDAKSGKELWTFDLGTVMKSSPVVTADGVIFVGEVNGRFHILKDAGDHCESLDAEHFVRDDKAVVEIYGSPAFANGRVFLTDRYSTYCFGSKEKAKERVAIPPLPKEPYDQTAPEAGAKLQLMLIPAETTLAPGQKIKFAVVAYDDFGRGRSEIGLKPEPEVNPKSPVLTVDGVDGVVDATGTFTASEKSAYSAGTVKLKMLDAEATARVRIVPKLPISESFDGMKEGTQPPGWIGVDGKTKLVQRDGSLVLQKLTESPSAPACRMQAYASGPLPIGYTVEADLMGLAKEGTESREQPVLSDMGLINVRYDLMLLGEEQQLRLVTWPSLPRLQKDVAFSWKPGVWYRAKLRVERKGDQAWVRGKAWPKGEKEPDAWQVEMMDPCPNHEGSPGLYAYTKGATPKRAGAVNFFDNLRVYANE